MRKLSEFKNTPVNKQIDQLKKKYRRIDKKEKCLKRFCGQDVRMIYFVLGGY